MNSLPFVSIIAGFFFWGKCLVWILGIKIDVFDLEDIEPFFSETSSPKSSNSCKK